MYAVGLAARRWALWRTRNAVCLDQKKVKSPTEIVCMICSFIVYWAGLFKDEMEAQIVQRAGVIKEAALFFHRKDAEKQSLEERRSVPYVG
jgi:hypothetical protein